MSFWLDMENPTTASRHVETPVRRGMEEWPREVLGSGDISTGFCRRLRALLLSDPAIRPQNIAHSERSNGRGEHRGTNAPPAGTNVFGIPPPNPVFIPVNWWGYRQTAEALLYCDRRGLHLVRANEPHADRLEHRLFRYSAIGRIERGRMLLHSWIVVQDDAGSVTVEFNTAAEDVLSPLLRHLRRAAFGARFVENGDLLGHRDFRWLDPRIDPKFANYAGECLVSREELITLRYFTEPPPEVRRLVILTKREVIDISERVRSTPTRPQYGGVWSYTAVWDDNTGTRRV